MTDDAGVTTTQQTTVEALQAELAELEASLAAIHAQRAARAQAEVDALEQAREEYRHEWEEKQAQLNG